MRRIILAAVLLALPTLVPPADAAERPVRFGVHGNWASDDVDFGLGARAQIGLADFYEGLRGVASFDYYFPGNDVDYWELNGNLTYTLRGDLAPYVGAGLNYGHASAGPFGESDLGLNLLGGLRLSDRLFGEAKLELGGGELFVVSAGILF